jgi:carbon storage regulator
MLVLTRKLGETIIINDNIRVTIVDIGSGRVRVGIDAPTSVPVHREELLKVVEQATAPVETPADQPVQLHNRISGKYPAPVVPPATSMSEESTATLENRLKKLRRKPR